LLAADWVCFAPVVVGCAGTSLTPGEIDLFRRHRPLGRILFARNIEDPSQVRALVESFRAVVGHPRAPVLIDQEGGRVARLKPPHWPVFPAAARFGALFDTDPEGAAEAAFLNGLAIGTELAALGIDVDCAPVADLPVAGAHDVIGDRAYGADPQRVAILARATMAGLLAAGVLPVVKHIPGHGRARADSHLELPIVDCDLEGLQTSDFLPFSDLKDAPWAMTAHILYPALDRKNPATSSPKIISEVIRGRIGFAGVLISDDLTMKALAGSLCERAAAALDAGCDLVLHCSGNFAEMQELFPALPAMTSSAAERLAQAAAALPAQIRACSAADQERMAQLLDAGRPHRVQG